MRAASGFPLHGFNFEKVLPETASAPGTQMGRKREGAKNMFRKRVFVPEDVGTVSLNHPLAANS